jgi:hypothetical protein
LLAALQLQRLFAVYSYRHLTLDGVQRWNPWLGAFAEHCTSISLHTSHPNVISNLATAINQKQRIDAPFKLLLSRVSQSARDNSIMKLR